MKLYHTSKLVTYKIIINKWFNDMLIINKILISIEFH